MLRKGWVLPGILLILALLLPSGSGQASPCPPDEPLPSFVPSGLQPRSGPVPGSIPTSTPAGPPGAFTPRNSGGGTPRAGGGTTRVAGGGGVSGGAVGGITPQRKLRSRRAQGSFDWLAWWEFHKELLLFGASERHSTESTAHNQRAASPVRSAAANSMYLALDCKNADWDDSHLKAEAALALTRLQEPLSVKALKEQLGGLEQEPTELGVRTLMALAHIGSAEAEEVLLSVLMTPRFSMELRGIAAAGLGVQRKVDRKTIDALMDVARSGAWHDDLRASCFLALGGLRDPRGIDFLKDRLAHEESKALQSLLLTALSMTHHPGATPIMMSKAKSTEPFVKWSAISGLGALLDGTGRLTGESADTAGFASADLAKQRKVASQFLVTLLKKGGDDRVRAHAAMALGRIGGSANSDVLLKMIRETKGHLRSAVSLGLALAGAKNAQNEMVRLLLDNSETDSTRAAAALSLGILGDLTQNSRGNLQNSLGGHMPPPIRRYAAIALGMIHDNVATKDLQRMLFSPKSDLKLRVGAATALSLVGTPTALKSIIDAVDREDDLAAKSDLMRCLNAFPNDRPVSYLNSIVEEQPSTELAKAAVHVTGHIVSSHRPPLFAKYLCNWNYFLRVKPFDILHEFI